MPEPALLAELKKRKLLTVQKRISFKINKGPKFALEVVKEETDLTAEMIARYLFSLSLANPSHTQIAYLGSLSGAWKDKSFKPYNFSALGAHTLSGALHPR